MFYNKILDDCIEREKAGSDYFYETNDKQVLRDMCQEINESLGTSIQYLAEIDALDIKNSGHIMAKYINKFSSETVKSFLVPQMVSDKIENCDMIVLQLYKDFKVSNEYISPPGKPAPAHIYVRYDNAFRRLRSKRIKSELLELLSNPRDAFYLPFTIKMLASWKVAELKNLLISYSKANSLTANDFGFLQNTNDYFPSLSFMKRELRLSAIACLKYYPSADVYELVYNYLQDPDPDVRSIATKSLKAITKINQKAKQETVL